MRDKGQGSVYYRKRRERWYASIIDPLNKTKEESPAFKEKDDALNWLTAKNSAILVNSFVSKNKYTVGTWVLDYLDNYSKPNVKPSTFQRYTELADKFDPISAVPLQQLTSVQVQHLINELPEDLSSSTKNKVFKLLRQSLDQAVRCRLLSFNPASVLKAPKVEQEEVQIFTPEEICLILAKVQIRTKSQTQLYKHHDLILLASTTGMRLGELLGLEWADIDFKDCSLKVRRNIRFIRKELIIGTPKSAAGTRKIPLPKEVVEVLKIRKQNEKLLALDGSDFVFHARNKYKIPLRESTIERAWKSILNYVGVPYRKFHSLRHTHATQLLASGVPLLEVSRRLGHAKPSHTLDLYGHAIPELASDIVEKIEKIYSL